MKEKKIKSRGSKIILIILIVTLIIIGIIYLRDKFALQKYTSEMQIWNGCKQAEVLNPKDNSETKPVGRISAVLALDSTRNLDCGEKPEKPNYIILK